MEARYNSRREIGDTGEGMVTPVVEMIVKYLMLETTVDHCK